MSMIEYQTTNFSTDCRFRRAQVNLNDLCKTPKEGSHFDLPIALAMMVAMGAISPDAIEGYAAIGELALDASIRGVPGALPAAIGANAMGKGLICPATCGPEAAWADEEMPVLAAPHLLSLVNHFAGLQTLARPEAQREAEYGAAARSQGRQGPGKRQARAWRSPPPAGHNL
jgi:magnesium chelatase family protein